MNRRNILRLLTAAPVAGPSVAKEAARRMGLYTAAFFAGVPQQAEQTAVAHDLGGSVVPMEREGGAYLKYLQRELTDFYSEEAQLQRTYEAKYRARGLDPDLAALRSVSPAWAYQTQYARMVTRVHDDRYGSIQRRIITETKRATGVG